MIYEEQYLIHLLSVAIRAGKPEQPGQQISWEKLYKLAEEQKIAPLIFEPICRLEKEFQPPQKIMEFWAKESLACTYFYALQTEEIHRVLREAEKQKVDMLILKGTVVRELYPVPELRTMSDCDVIIKREQLEKVKELFFSCGYGVKRELEETVEFSKENTLKFETFYSVFSRLNPKEGFNGDMWADSCPFVGEYVRKPSAEDFFVHAVAHLAKHMVTRGAGLRNLADMVLLIEKTEINWQKAIDKIALLNVEKFFYGVMRALEKYFNIKIPFNCPEFDGKSIDGLMEFMARNGIYGFVDNLFIFDARNARGKKLDRIKRYIIRIFPTREKLSNRYAYAKKHPVLMPVAWIHRLIKALFIDKFSVSHGLESMKNASGQAESQIEVLNYFDMDYDSKNFGKGTEEKDEI